MAETLCMEAFNQFYPLCDNERASFRSTIEGMRLAQPLSNTARQHSSLFQNPKELIIILVTA